MTSHPLYTAASTARAGLMTAAMASTLFGTTTPNQVYRSGSVGVPAWGPLAAADIPNLSSLYDAAGAATTAQAYAVQRANHTGTQAASTITGLGTAAALNTGTTAGTIATVGNDPSYAKLSGATFTGAVNLGGASGHSYFDANGDLNVFNGVYASSFSIYKGGALQMRFAANGGPEFPSGFSVSGGVGLGQMHFGPLNQIFAGQTAATPFLIYHNNAGVICIGDSATSQSGSVIDLALPTSFRGNATVGGTLGVTGAATFTGGAKFPSTAAAPSNATTPTAWLAMTVNATVYKLPLYL